MHKRIWLEILKERNNLENLDVDVSIMLMKIMEAVPCLRSKVK
jgi:hypothetical protein